MLSREEDKELASVLQDMGLFRASDDKKITIKIESEAVLPLVISSVEGLLPWEVSVEQGTLGNFYVTFTK